MSCLVKVLARSSPDDKHLLVTRLNGTALPRDRSEWEELHPELDWNVDRDRTLPGYWDEVGSNVGGLSCVRVFLLPRWLMLILICKLWFLMMA